MSKIMKRLALTGLGAVLALGGVAVATETASANTTLGPGWSIWTREYCEDGKFVNMRRLTFGAKVQGREYVYKRNGRLCAFTVDHLTGSHNMMIWGNYGRSWGIDGGYFSEYAGAVAGPAGRCLTFSSNLQLPGRGTTYLYTTPKRTFC